MCLSGDAGSNLTVLSQSSAWLLFCLRLYLYLSLLIKSFANYVKKKKALFEEVRSKVRNMRCHDSDFKYSGMLD